MLPVILLFLFLQEFVVHHLFYTPALVDAGKWTPPRRVRAGGGLLYLCPRGNIGPELSLRADDRSNSFFFFYMNI